MSRRLLPVLGIVLVGLTTYIASLGDLTQRIPLFLAVFGAAFAVYLAAVYIAGRNPGPSRGTLVWIFAVAVACRGVCLVPAPTLSDDIYRYVWEGRVVARGHNPFALAPEAAELEYLRDGNYDRINHPHLGTIYPPLAQAVFALGAVVKPDVRTQKILFTLFDLATLLVIMQLLRMRNRSLGWAIVYAWSPLVVIEFALSGHMDAIGIFLLMLSILLFESRRRGTGMVALGLSFLAKFLSILLVPFFLFKKGYVRWIAVFVVVIVAGYLPFAGASDKLFASLQLYGRHWEFNSIVYTLLAGVIDNGDRIRVGLLAVITAFALWRGYRDHDLVRCALWVVGCSLLLSPTVYPWYVAWMVPLLCFRPSRAWIYFSGAVVLSYWVWKNMLATGVWELGAGVLVAEYVPFLALLGYEGYRAWRPVAGKGS